MKKFLLLFVYITLIIFILKLSTDVLPFKENGKFFRWDHENYIKMAENGIIPGKMFCNNPYCYRIMIPAIVSVFPKDSHSLVFLIITYFGVYASIFAFFVFLRSLKFNEFLSFAGINLFIFSRFAIKFSIFDVYRPEALSIFFVLISLICLIKKKDFLFILFVVLGVLTKEQVLGVLPAYYFYHAKSILDFKTLRKTLIISFIPIFVFVGVRLIYVTFNPEYANNLKYFFRLRVFHEKGINLIVSLFSALGVVCYIFIFNLKKIQKFYQKHIFLLSYIFFQFIVLLCGGNDLERFALYVFPAVIPAVVYIFQKANLRQILFLMMFQIVISKFFNYYTLNGKADLINERAYLENFAFYMNQANIKFEVIRYIIFGGIYYIFHKIIYIKK